MNNKYRDSRLEMKGMLDKPARMSEIVAGGKQSPPRTRLNDLSAAVMPFPARRA
jgi:hypothetical protein